jgi:glucosamine-6-phosphate deaminase
MKEHAPRIEIVGNMSAVANGLEKAAAISAAIEGPIAAACPASALRLRGNVDIICDEAAAAALATRPNNRRRA